VTNKFYLDKRIRTFVYLSNAKLEPLYAHIKEPIRKRVALRLGIGVPGLPVGPRVEAEVPAASANEIGMLAVVLSHLDEAGRIGTIDKPDAYFAGQLTLRWASVDEFLFLTASTEDTLVALTGSNRHLIGHFEADLPAVAYPASNAVGFDRAGRHMLAGDEEQSDYASFLVTRLAVGQRHGPQESLEFVARRLAFDQGFIAGDWAVAADYEHFRGRDFRVLLGTPLYLAYTD
jgi:hypothetical protein